MPDEENLIPYDRMKEQIEREVFAFLEKSPVKDVSAPVFSFEKGATHISISTRPLTDTMLFEYLGLVKKHIAHIRVHAFDEGYYAFQALNRNMFKADGMLDNYKIEFFSLSSSARMEISKKGNFSQEEVNLTVELFKRTYSSAAYDPRERLKNLGAMIITGTAGISWDYIAGYEEVKRKIKESVILPLKNPGLYDAIAGLTRNVFESNRPRAVLFDGQPGVGKTTAARIIAGEVDIPLVYIPIESIMSKWYGQSSRNLSEIFDACEDMGGAIIFLDEIDSLAGSRDQNMFEATRRVLSVLLRRLDGIDAAMRTITIGATNRKGDLDHALISRFDQAIYFPMPNAAERSAIFSNYAKQLSPGECAILGEKSDGLSGRNIKDICEFTERRWARKILIKKETPSPPSFDYYRQSIPLWKNQE